MIGWLLATRPVRWLAWALGGAIAFIGYGAIKKREGYHKARAEAEAQAAKDYRDTRKRIDHGTRDAGTGTDDDIRKRLRERAKR